MLSPNFKKKKELESLPCFAADLCRSIHKSWNQPKSATCAELALPTQEMAIYSPLTPDTPDPEAPPQAVDKPEASQHWPLRHSATRALFSKTLHGRKYTCQNMTKKSVPKHVGSKVDEGGSDFCGSNVLYILSMYREIPWGQCCHLQFVCIHSLYCHRCLGLQPQWNGYVSGSTVSTTPPTWLVGMCQDAPLPPNG